MTIFEQALARAVRLLLRLLLGFYFSRIERFHVERAPLTGPALFVSNHPASVTDAFVIGTSVGRRVHFVATVQLFRMKPLAWFLKQCGVIPVNRMKDDPRAMRSVADTFEACFKVLERGEAIGIFPEGITYDDGQLKAIKTGAARMALELEHRHGGTLGLNVVPVGLTYSAKEIYRSDVLVHFGEPLRAADFLEGYAERRKECINRLNGEIEQRLQSLIVHLPELELARIVEAVKHLYLDRLKLGSVVIKEPIEPQAEELMLTQAIRDATAHTARHDPERLERFARKLDRYERWLARLKLSDGTVQRFESNRGAVLGSAGSAALAVIGFPVALFGWMHRLAPAALAGLAARRMTDPDRRKAQTPHAAMLVGLVSFGLFYPLYVWLAHVWLGWPASFWYALSLPVAGLAAYYYRREVARLADGLRTIVILLRVPFARGRLLKMRADLRREIEQAREEYGRTNLVQAP